MQRTLLLLLIAVLVALSLSLPVLSASSHRTARRPASRGSVTRSAASFSAPAHTIHTAHRRRPSSSSSAAVDAADSPTARRLLQVSETDAVVIPLSTANQTADHGEEYLSAVSYVFNELSASSPSFILFPYAFSLSNGSLQFPQGAFVSTTEDPSIDSSLPTRGQSDDFNYAVSVAALLLASAAGNSQAQTVYDSSIAIFLAYGVLPSDPSGTVRMLTNEAPNVCQALYGSISGKWAQCWQSSAWLQYLASASQPESTSIVYLEATDIESGLLLTSSGSLRFGQLIFADIYLGSADVILGNISQAAVDAIQLFVSSGGTVISSGKGAAIVQGLGLLSSASGGAAVTDVFSNSAELVALNDYSNVATTGCAQESNAVALSDADFTRRTLCFSLGTGAAASVTTALISSPPVNLQALNQTSLRVIASFNTAASALVLRNSTGLSSAVSGSSTPALLYGQLGKGQLILHLGNPPIVATSYPWLYNMLFLANSRPALLQPSFPANTPDIIPALEQVSVTMNLEVANLYDEELQAVQLLVWPADGVLLMDYPTLCQPPANLSSVVAPAGSLNSSGALDCSPSSGVLPPLSGLLSNYTVFIEDVLVTQRETGIVLLVSQLSYSLSSRGGLVETVEMPMTVSAYVAAEVVGDYNADPMGFYPLPGVGQFIDNVLTAENKQETTAFNFIHTAIVPLITPLVDISLQSQVVRYLDFDYLYYEAAVNGVFNYLYPQPNPAGGFSASNPAPFDFLDYVLLNLRGDSLAANWDEPVYPTKQARNSTFPNYPPPADVGVQNISLAQYDVSNNNQYVVVKQLAFGDAQDYFTYPSPRMMAFFDTTQPQAFATYNVNTSWPGGVQAGGFPAWMLSPSGNALRQQLGFGANTIFFYGSLAGELTYPLPAGIDSTDAVLTLDRYSNSTAACASGIFSGSASVRSVQGYYSSADVDRNPPGMLANEYTNGVTAWCSKQGSSRINLTALSELSNGSSSLTHYIVPLSSNSDITSGDDVMYMMPDSQAPGEWYYAPSTLTEQPRYGDYPELRMKYVYTALFQLQDAISFRGGILSWTLPTGWGWAAGVDPIAMEYITWSADEVSFTSTVYDAAAGSLSSQFYRGELPDENSNAPSQLQVYLENLQYQGSSSGLPASFSSTFTLQSLVYDLSLPPTFEIFTPVPSFTQTLSFNSQISLVLPALRLQFEYSRTPTPTVPLSPSSLLNPIKGETGNVSYLLAYEDDQPFVRYGVYTQELMAHRTVYGSEQFNPVSDTGLVTVNGGFSYITNLGESSIPYRQFLTTGAGQLIPGTATTGRMSWLDLWGRQLVEPVRSLFVDAAPLPGPLRNFQMTTTFELLEPTSSERTLTWHSDDVMTVRVQVKLLNNYEKWWCLTTSKQNELIYTAGLEYPGTTFVTPASSYSNQQPSSPSWAASNTTYLQYGYGDFYGVSLSSGMVWLGGSNLTALQEYDVSIAIYCVDNYNASCDFIGRLPLPSVQPSTATVIPPYQWWNFASAVDAYWPSGYVTESMWGLTVPSYDDNVFDYGYNYQFDNRLPTVDTGLIKPENIVSYPVFNGIGYACQYSSSLSHPNFPGVQGWWSDNLQNRDDTVLAGQTTSHTISVGQPDLTLAPGWVDIAQLTAGDNSSTSLLQQSVTSALGNIYTCLFNRHRIVTRADNPRVVNAANTVQNNIVPVDPTLTTDDPRYTAFPCSDYNGAQYTADTISQFDNYLETNTNSNYLYFAANLRGGALEDINMLYSLNPISGVQQEGITTVQEGGEFVYWNPSLGPNAYETVDDPVSNVNAMRTDMTLKEALYPAVATTFDSTIFQLLTLSDPAEINNQWTLTDCDQQYGFGDSAVRTFTGGNYGSENIVEPGGTTYVEIDFFNNAGFDWNLLAGAIESETVGQEAFNAVDLQANIAPVITAPTAYNFMSVQLPPELVGYLTVTPSQYNAGLAPLEFDFTSNNVATIRDGFQGSYFYKIAVASNLSQELLGRIYFLPVLLNQTWFQQLPGYNDPTGIHDYTLSIPPITIGFPYSSGTANYWDGNCYYVNGRGSNLTFNHLLDTAFTPVGAKTVSQDDILALELLTEASVEPQQLDAFWSSLNNSWNLDVSYAVVPKGGSLNSVEFNFTSISPTGLFPIPVSPLLGPDPAEVYILLNTFAPSLQPVYPNRVTQDSSMNFLDWMNVTKGATVGYSMSVYAQGPYLSLSYAIVLVDSNLQPLADQSLHCGDSGLLQLTLTVQNIGTSFAYDVSMAASLSNVAFNASVQQPVNYGLNVTVQSLTAGGLVVNVSTTEVIADGGALAAVLLLSYALPVPVNSSCNSTVVFGEGADCNFAFFPSGALPVQQNITTRYSIPVSQLPRLAVSMNASQSAANSSVFSVSLSAPNLPLSDVLAYLNTSRFPSVSSSDWAFAYQLQATITANNEWNNGTVTNSSVLATVFSTVSNSTFNLTAQLPSWDTVTLQALLGVSSVLSSDSDGLNQDPAATFVPAETSNQVTFMQPSSSSSDTAKLVEEIVIPIVVGLLLALLCLLGCVLYRRRDSGNKKQTDYAAPPTVITSPRKLREVQMQPLDVRAPTYPLQQRAAPFHHSYVPDDGALAVVPESSGPKVLMTGVTGLHVIDMSAEEQQRRRLANQDASDRIRRGNPPPLPASRPSSSMGNDYMDTADQYEGEHKAAPPVITAAQPSAPPIPATRPSLPPVRPPAAAAAFAPPLPSSRPRLSAGSSGGDYMDTADQFEGERKA